MNSSLLQLSFARLQVAMMRAQLATLALRCERFAHVKFVISELNRHQRHVLE